MIHPKRRYSRHFAAPATDSIKPSTDEFGQILGWMFSNIPDDEKEASRQFLRDYLDGKAELPTDLPNKYNGGHTPKKTAEKPHELSRQQAKEQSVDISGVPFNKEAMPYLNEAMIIVAALFYENGIELPVGFRVDPAQGFFGMCATVATAISRIKRNVPITSIGAELAYYANELTNEAV